MIRTLLVDDDPFIRESLKLILGMQGDIDIVGTCTDGAEAARFVEGDNSVDVVLMDIRMPECDGVQGTKRIKAESPQTAVLILTTFDDDDYILEALKNGANGYMLKNVPPDRIAEGIRTVHHGNMLIHPDVAKKLAGFLRPSPPAAPADDPAGRLDGFGLTPTEQQVVRKIADGLSNKEIAQALFLSEGTVKNYISAILDKLSLRDRTQIAIFYWKKTTEAG